MRKQIFAPLLLSFLFISNSQAVPTHQSYHHLPPQELIAIIEAQNTYNQNLQDHQSWKETKATLKGIVFGSAATYAALWWFNIHPQVAHKNLFRMIFSN